jgi:hypothetical protein
MHAVRSAKRPTPAGRFAVWWRHRFPTKPRRLLPTVGWAAVAVLALFSLYIANLQNIGWDHETIVFGQSNLASNAPAAFRVVTYKGQDAPTLDRGVPVSISLRDQNGAWHGLYDGNTNANGTVDAGFHIPANVDGDCELQVRTGPWYHPEVMTRSISVHRRTRVLLATDRPVYDIGDVVHIRALANYVGPSRPAAGQAVHFEIKDPSGATVYHTDAVAANWGIASTDFAIDDIAAEGQYQISASVDGVPSTQTVTVEHGSNTAANPGLNIAVVPENGRTVSGFTNAFYIVTSYADGTPAVTTGAIKTPEGLTVPFKTNALGIAEANVKLESMTISLTARDSAGRTGYTTGTLDNPATMRMASADDIGVHVSAAGENDGIVVNTDKSVYRAGDTLYAGVFARKMSGPVYFDLTQDGQTIMTRSTQLDNGKGELAIDIPGDVSGVLTLDAYYINDERAMVRSVRRVIVEPANPVNVNVAAIGDGDSGKLSIHTADQSGHGVACAVGVNVVDNGVYALQEGQRTFEASAPIGDPAADLRTSVALALLPGPKNYTIDAPASILRHVPDLDLGDTDYDLRYDSGIQRRIDIPRLQSEYFAGLGIAVEIAAIIIAALLFMKRSTAALAGWVVISIPIVLVGFASIVVGVILALIGLGIAVLSRYTEVSILAYAAAAASIAILAAVLFPVFAQAREKARNISAISVLKQLRLIQLEDEQGRESASMQTRPDAEQFGTGRHLPPTLYWNPEVITDGNGNATVQIPLGETRGNWRVSATASTMDGRVGSTSIMLPGLPPARQAGTPVPR